MINERRRKEKKNYNIASHPLSQQTAPTHNSCASSFFHLCHGRQAARAAGARAPAAKVHWHRPSGHDQLGVEVQHHARHLCESRRPSAHARLCVAGPGRASHQDAVQAVKEHDSAGRPAAGSRRRRRVGDRSQTRRTRARGASGRKEETAQERRQQGPSTMATPATRLLPQRISHARTLSVSTSSLRALSRRVFRHDGAGHGGIRLRWTWPKGASASFCSSLSIRHHKKRQSKRRMPVLLKADEAFQSF